MSDLKTSRPFQERFLDGFDRSELRREVQSVRPRRFQKLKKKYASIALGASLAFGGLGVPMKIIHDSQNAMKSTRLTSNAAGAPSAAPDAIEGDLDQAKAIADQVAGGVNAVAGGVAAAASGVAAAASGVTEVATAPLKTVVEAPKKLSGMTEQVKEQFFKTQVPFGSIIYNEAKKNNIPPELVAAVAHTESKFKPHARSAAGAVGLMQLVPRTGRWMGAKDLTNPSQNVAAGAKYLRYLHDRFDGDTQKVIAAYNAGEGNVRRFNGVPPFRETRNYVQRVGSFERELKDQMKGTVADIQMVAEAR